MHFYNDNTPELKALCAQFTPLPPPVTWGANEYPNSAKLRYLEHEDSNAPLLLKNEEVFDTF